MIIHRKRLAYICNLLIICFAPLAFVAYLTKAPGGKKRLLFGGSEGSAPHFI